MTPSAPSATAAAFALSLLALIPAQAGDSATLWPPDQVLDALHSRDAGIAALAEGSLYLLPAADFPLFEAALAKRMDQPPTPFETAISRALVLRGHPPALSACARAMMAGGGGTYAYFQGEQALFANSTPEELMPLARALVPLVEGADKRLTWQGNEFWIHLAGRTGEPQLLQLAVQVAMSPLYRLARGTMAGRLAPDRCAERLVPMLTQGTSEAKIAHLELLGRGWHDGPGRAVAAVMSDPDANVRIAFVQTLAESTSERALDLILQGLGDGNQQVRAGSMNALAAFRGRPQTELVRRIALDPRMDLAVRQRAWGIFAALPGDALAPAAKAMVGEPMAERSLRAAAISYLVAHQGKGWLLQALPHLEMEARGAVLAALARGGALEVLGEVPAFLRQAAGQEVGEVIGALGALKDPRVVPLLIALLEDPRPEARQGALSALITVSGLSYRPSPGRRGEAAPAAAESKSIHAAWQQWFEVFGAPLAPAQLADLELVRAALLHATGADGVPLVGLSGDPFPLLLRLVGERTVSAQALNQLVANGDPRTAKQLIALLDGPLFTQRCDELGRALLRCPPDPALVTQLNGMLERPALQPIALQVLVAWRASSPEMLTALFHGQYWSPRMVADLAGWPDCPVLSAARRYLINDKIDEHVRNQALQLLMQIGDERDIKALAAEVIQGTPLARNAVAGLVNMALSGLDGASASMAGMLEQAARRAGGPAHAPKPGEVGKPAPDPAPMIIAMLNERLHAAADAGHGPPALDSEPLKAGVRAWLKATRDETSLHDGLAVLLLINDAAAVEVLRAQLASADAARQRRLCDLVLATAQPELRACVDLLQGGELADPALPARLLAWYRTKAKLPAAELAMIEAQLQAALERQVGRPVRGMSASIEYPGSSAPAGAKGLKAKVVIRNLGKKPFRCFPENLQFSLGLQQAGAGDSGLRLPLHLEVKPKPTPPPGSGTQVTVIEPGQSFSATGWFDAPPAPGATATTRLRLVWNVPDSLGGDDPQGGGTFTTAWTEFSFIPPLWEAIDRRSASRAP